MQTNHVITLTCPSCGAKVSIEEGANRFTCSYCGNEHVMQFSVQPVASTERPIRPRAPMPSSIQSTQTEDGSRRLVKRWFGPKYIFLAVFTLFWDGFIIFFYSAVLGFGAPTIMAIFPLLHVAVGVYLTYSTLAGFINRTTVELTRESLDVMFDPLPWPGEKSLPINQVRQLFCKEKVRHSKNGTRVTYDLYALDQNDHQIRLLSGMDSPDEAQYFEQQIESWLRIKDQPVMGEYR